MQLANSLQTLNPSLPFSRSLTCGKSMVSPKKRVYKSICARRDYSNSDDGVKGKLVDENMIVLRLRIQEMKEEEEELQNYTTKSEKWMEWEREWCKNYESDVLEGVGMLQMLLMNTRPSFAIGVVAFLMFSVSTSLAVALCYLLHFLLD